MYHQPCRDLPASPRLVRYLYRFRFCYRFTSHRSVRLLACTRRVSACPPVRVTATGPPSCQLPCRVDSNACARDLAVLPGLGYLLTYHIAQDSCHSPANPDSVPAREGVVVPAPMAALTPAAAERAAA